MAVRTILVVAIGTCLYLLKPRSDRLITWSSYRFGIFVQRERRNSARFGLQPVMFRPSGNTYIEAHSR